MIKAKKGEAKVFGDAEEVMEDLVCVYGAVQEYFGDVAQDIWIAISEFYAENQAELTHEVRRIYK